MQAANIWDWPLQRNDDLVNVVNERDRFEAELPVPLFRENEIDAKVINDELVVHCQSEAEPGRLPREIHRAYRLPSDIDGNSIRTTLRSDGTLKVTANKRGI